MVDGASVDGSIGANFWASPCKSVKDCCPFLPKIGWHLFFGEHSKIPVCSAQPFAHVTFGDCKAVQGCVEFLSASAVVLHRMMPNAAVAKLSHLFQQGVLYVRYTERRDLNCLYFLIVLNQLSHVRSSKDGAAKHCSIRMFNPSE